MYARFWNAQQCMSIVMQLICIVSLVNCSPPNLIDPSRVPPSAGTIQVVSTIQSIRKDAEQLRQIETNLTQVQSNTTRNEPNVEANGVNEQRSITIRLDDLQELLTELMKVDAKDMDNSVEKRAESERAFITDLLFNEKFIRRVKKFTEKYIFQAGSASSALNNAIPSDGRVFFFKGDIFFEILSSQLLEKLRNYLQLLRNFALYEESSLFASFYLHCKHSADCFCKFSANFGTFSQFSSFGSVFRTIFSDLSQIFPIFLISVSSLFVFSFFCPICFPE